MSEVSNKKSISEDEVDIIEFTRRLWSGRKTIVITTVVFLILGGLSVLVQKFKVIPEYKSNLTLVTDSPTPELLPTLITGKPFMTEVLKLRLILPGSNKSITVLEALNDHTQPPQGSLAGLMGRITTTSGNAGTLQISVMMQEPILARQLADSIGQRLGQYLLTFRTQRTQKKLAFLIKRYNETEEAYLQSLKTLSDFHTQRNHNSKLTDTLTLLRLKSEIDLRFEVCCELAKKLENAKITEQDQIPVINILEPASPASQNNAPKTRQTMFLMLILGLLGGLGIVFGKQIYHIFMNAARRKQSG